MRAALADASYFPVDLDVPRGRVHLLRIAPEVLSRSVFLDNRIDAPLAQADRLEWSAIAPLLPAATTPAFLFHTSFCCSTLLARALHHVPERVALKEPLVTRRLADARAQGLGIEHPAALCVRLLARPWAERGRVLIKPTHAALNVAAELLEVEREARGVLLFGGLEDFLVSNLKKTAETQARVRPLAERAMAATAWTRSLPDHARAPETWPRWVALQWAAQLAVARDLFASEAEPRLRSLREIDLLENLPETVVACARWLQLPHEPAALAAHALACAGEHAKAPGQRYGMQRRREEADFIRRSFGPDILDALRWAERELFPSLGEPSLPQSL